MALIRCPDCGHKVSDLAFACPQCARPVAALLGEQAAPKVARAVSHGGARIAVLRPHVAPAEPPGPDASRPQTTPLGPAIVKWAAELASVSETDETSKRCTRCRQSVARDSFRYKEASGYVCRECQQESADRSLRKQDLVERWLRIALVCLLIGVVTTGFILGGTALVQQIDSHSKRK
jgi:hypothetical protein